MACIIKAPRMRSKGILSVTTPEEIEIRSNPRLLNSFQNLKNDYITCLHYNWHDFDAKPDDLFDIHLAGEDDLIVTNGTNINIFEFDACNFTKKDFDISTNEKHWDILYVARAVFFKGIPEFLDTIRKLYDSGHLLRVLFICPMPAGRASDSTTLYNLRKMYEEKFSAEEQNYFNLLIIRDNYPFFFDRQTLAHFYKSSKIFVHTAPDERRCRVAAYAWCTGLPVIGKKNVAAILPMNLRKKPAFYQVTGEDFKNSIIEALNFHQPFDIQPYQNQLSEKYMIKNMIDRFKNYFSLKNMTFEGLMYTDELDIRLGRHIRKSKNNPNAINMSLDNFFDVVRNIEQISKIPEDEQDPEKYIASNLIEKKENKIDFYSKIIEFLKDN